MDGWRGLEWHSRQDVVDALHQFLAEGLRSYLRGPDVPGRGETPAFLRLRVLVHTLARLDPDGQEELVSRVLGQLGAMAWVLPALLATPGPWRGREQRLMEVALGRAVTAVRLRQAVALGAGRAANADAETPGPAPRPDLTSFPPRLVPPPDHDAGPLETR